MKAIGDLSEAELSQVQEQVRARYQELQTSQRLPTAVWVARLDAAIGAMRESLTEVELAEIGEAMNAEYVNPDDLHLFDWIDELPEDER